MAEEDEKERAEVAISLIDSCSARDFIQIEIEVQKVVLDIILTAAKNSPDKSIAIEIIEQVVKSVMFPSLPFIYRLGYLDGFKMAFEFYGNKNNSKS